MKYYLFSLTWLIAGILFANVNLGILFANLNYRDKATKADRYFFILMCLLISIATGFTPWFIRQPIRGAALPSFFIGIGELSQQYLIPLFISFLGWVCLMVIIPALIIVSATPKKHN